MVIMSKGKRVGLYLRVSTSGQTVETQRIDLERVAEHRGWVIVDTYIDHGISGSKGREKRPGFARLAKDAAQGRLDIVVSWSIDRIGSSIRHLVAFMDELLQHGVGIYLHQQQVDSGTAAGRAFLQMAGVLAEFERSVIVERINAGLARAKAEGKQLGRPRVSGETEVAIRKMLKKGAGKLKIARKLRVGVSTVQRIAGGPLADVRRSV
jgi:DNA invertase Pin-like site-specific DNA recombinase